MSTEDIIAKYVFGPLSKAYGKADDYIKEKTGKSLTNRMVEQEEVETKLKEEHPFLWAAKKLGQGALKGIFGSMLSKN